MGGWKYMMLVAALLGCSTAAGALEIPPLRVGGGGGISTVYLGQARGQVNLPVYQIQAQTGPEAFSFQARGGSSGQGGDKALASGSLLTTQFDYFYSLMLKSGFALFDPANTMFFQGGWSKFRMRSTENGFSTLSNRASFGFGIGLRRDLGGGFGVSAEYMRYSGAIRAGSINLDYAP